MSTVVEKDTKKKNVWTTVDIVLDIGNKETEGSRAYSIELQAVGRDG